jgi:NADH-quinone oxidoreductase subunit E
MSKITEEEREKLEAMLSAAPTRQAAALEVLKELQARRGWISDETLAQAAELVGISPTELEGIATFFDLIFRKPVGKHVILVCDSITCWILGSERIIDHLRRKLGIGMGETTSDGEFTLLYHSCLGNCDHAPTMMVDGQYYNDLTPERIDNILEQLRQQADGSE